MTINIKDKKIFESKQKFKITEILDNAKELGFNGVLVKTNITELNLTKDLVFSSMLFSGDFDWGLEAKKEETFVWRFLQLNEFAWTLDSFNQFTIKINLLDKKTYNTIEIYPNFSLEFVEITE